MMLSMFLSKNCYLRERVQSSLRNTNSFESEDISMIKLPQYLYFSQAVEFVLNIQIKLKSQRMTILCCYLNIKKLSHNIFRRGQFHQS